MFLNKQNWMSYYEKKDDQEYRNKNERGPMYEEIIDHTQVEEIIITERIEWVVQN